MADVVIIDKDMGLKKIFADFKSLGKAEVTIGIQAKSKTTTTYARGRKSKAGVNIAQYGAYNEYGTKNIPERSFLRSSFDENLNLLQPFIEKQYGEIIDGKKTIQQGLGLIGETIQRMVKAKIRSITTPPNSPRTIAIKKSSKPLIDFGALIDAIRYEVTIK